VAAHLKHTGYPKNTTPSSGHTSRPIPGMRSLAPGLRASPDNRATSRVTTA
jgi:hypothetical protein